MNHSRRQFLQRSAVTAAAVPFLMSVDIDLCEASTGSGYDLSMGFPPDAIRLNYNENTLGPSPKAIAAAVAAVPDSFRYALSGLLRPHIGAYHDIEAASVLMGSGSSELLRLAPVAFAREGGNVVTSNPTWGGMLVVAENLGLTIKRVDLLGGEENAHDIDGLLAAVDSETRILMLVSPNNPTGSMASYDALKRIADALPEDVIFVIDEAYIDYQTEGKTGLDLVKEGYINVLVTRTFSKAHALAGMRCGYGLAHPDVLKRITRFGTGPASISRPAFAAVLGALDDPDQVIRSRTYVQKTRAYYQDETLKLGLKTISGPAPFMLVKLGDRARAIYEDLLAQHIFTTHGSSWGIPDYLRISYGRKEENEKFFAAFKKLI